MLFEWDPEKNASNIKKHRISFEIAITVFDDPLHLSVLDHKTRHEERWMTIGPAVTGAIIVVVHSYKELRELEIIRIISARHATRKEKKQYEEGI
jgi:uncharacterized DUF497 family protein